jgi:hypothetical protein
MTKESSADNMSKAELIEAHKVLERYHRLKAENAALDIFHDYHEQLADLLQGEINQLEKP